MRIRSLVYIIFLVLPFVNYAQSNDQLGLLPSINVKKNLKKDWTLNSKAEFRQSLYQENWDYDYVLTDFSLIGAKKISPHSKLALGYLIRFSGGDVVNRTIQQWSIIDPQANYKLAHRMSSDQTFFDSTVEYRLRYRLSAEIPLNGQSLDPEEFFIKLGNEYVNSFYEGEYDLEIRGLGFLGYSINQRNKVELGLDYRWDSFLNDAPRNRFWIGLNFYGAM